MKKVVGMLMTVAIGASSGAAVLVAAPGVALAADGCSSNRVCIFDSNNYKNRLGQRSAGEGRVNVSGDNNDRTDSWINDTSTRSAWYYNFTYENDSNCNSMAPHASNPNLGVYPSDELSSWRTNRGC